MSSVNLSQVQTVISSVAKVNWVELKKAFDQSKWVDVGALALIDAFEIVRPFFPQAWVAEDIIKFLMGLADSLPPSNSNKPISLETILKGITAAEGIDWAELARVMKANNAAVAGVVFVDDLVTIASPFFPPMMPAAIGIHALAMLAKNIHASQPESWPGFHYDSFWGWVPDNQMFKSPDGHVYKWNLQQGKWEKIK